MSTVILSCNHIQKKYNGRDVLTDVSFNVHRGEAVALVGENGCGKSTLLRILCGVTQATSGTVCLTSGLRSALIPDHFEKINMSAARFIEHMCQLEGTAPEAASKYYSLFAMNSYLDTPLRYLSKGMLQKVAVIQALLAERDILFMDEPLSGQDTESQLHFGDEIRLRKRNGMAVVMACHDPFLIEALADRVFQIKNGTLIDGTGYLMHNARHCALLVVPEGPAEGLIALLDGELPNVQYGVSLCGQLMRIEADRTDGRTLMELLLRRGVRIVRYEETI